MAPAKHFYFLPSLALVGATALWALSFIALKYSFRAYHPLVVIQLRMALASLVMACCFRKQLAVKVNFRELRPLVLLAIFDPCLYFIFESMGIRYTTASAAGVFAAIAPLQVAVAAWLLLRERTGRTTAIGFLLGIAGAVWLSVAAEASSAAPRPLLGNTLMFIAMLCGTGYTIMIKRVCTRHSIIFITAFQAMAGSIFFLPLALSPLSRPPLHFDPMSVLCIVYMAVFVTIGAYGLYNYGVSRMPTGQAALFLNLIPVEAILFGSLLLGEQFTLAQYPAAALVILGVIISQKGTGRRRRCEGGIETGGL